MRRWFKVGVFLGVITILSSLALAQLFGIRDYPGGSLRAIYKLTGENGTSGLFTVEIKPKEGNYSVRTVFEQVVKREDVGLAVFGFLGVDYRMEDPEEVIDLTPLAALDEREVEVGKNYLLAGGARLKTTEEKEIVGIKVIIGVFIHPGYPNQRVIIAIPELPLRRILPFPPLVQAEEMEGGRWVIKSKIELIEFVHQP